MNGYGVNIETVRHHAGKALSKPGAGRVQQEEQRGDLKFNPPSDMTLDLLLLFALSLACIQNLFLLKTYIYIFIANLILSLIYGLHKVESGGRPDREQLPAASSNLHTGYIYSDGGWRRSRGALW